MTLETSGLAAEELPYHPAPADNPLKGLVPYAGADRTRFPHSLEFDYLPLSDLMTGSNTFNWEPLEELLNKIASRRHQAVVRIWLEYPGKESGMPKFLITQGVKVTRWLHTDSDPDEHRYVTSPDYNDPKLHKAFIEFIHAFGDKYDGDPRLGFLTAGLLGLWGEWHTYPREALMANKMVQEIVMTAYAEAFRKTPVLLRYPANKQNENYAANADKPFGYHDDSFAWATLETGRKQDDWFYVPALKTAGSKALNKWQTQPIGGEIRPELWGQIFDPECSHPQAQNFSECVQQTHVSWLMDSGMFEQQQSDIRVFNAIKAVQSMGYEFHLVSANQHRQSDGTLNVEVKIRNTGVAPFYYDWKIQLLALSDHKIVKSFNTDWSVLGLLPESEPRLWSLTIPKAQRNFDFDQLAIQIVNPLSCGLPLRFANEYPEGSDGKYWPFPQ